MAMEKERELERKPEKEIKPSKRERIKSKDTDKEKTSTDKYLSDGKKKKFSYSTLSKALMGTGVALSSLTGAIAPSLITALKTSTVLTPPVPPASTPPAPITPPTATGTTPTPPTPPNTGTGTTGNPATPQPTPTPSQNYNAFRMNRFWKLETYNNYPVFTFQIDYVNQQIVDYLNSNSKLVFDSISASSNYELLSSQLLSTGAWIDKVNDVYYLHIFSSQMDNFNVLDLDWIKINSVRQKQISPTQVLEPQVNVNLNGEDVKQLQVQKQFKIKFGDKIEINDISSFNHNAKRSVYNSIMISKTEIKNGKTIHFTQDDVNILNDWLNKNGGLTTDLTGNSVFNVITFMIFGIPFSSKDTKGLWTTVPAEASLSGENIEIELKGSGGGDYSYDFCMYDGNSSYSAEYSRRYFGIFDNEITDWSGQGVAVPNSKILNDNEFKNINIWFPPEIREKLGINKRFDDYLLRETTSTKSWNDNDFVNNDGKAVKPKQPTDFNQGDGNFLNIGQETPMLYV